MNRETMLLKIAGVHGVLLGTAALAFLASGHTPRDLLLGGLLMAAVFGLSWGLVKGLVLRRRRGSVTALGIGKAGVYVALAVILVQEDVRIDPVAFAAGIVCFVVAVVGTVGTASLMRKPGTI